MLINTHKVFKDGSKVPDSVIVTVEAAAKASRNLRVRLFVLVEEKNVPPRLVDGEIRANLRAMGLGA